jgi:ABC-type antimicrobial peptide transport system permease subunit
MDPRTPARATAYLSDIRFPNDTRDLIVRASDTPQTIVPALRSAVAAVAPDVALYQVGLLARTVDSSVGAERFTTFVLSAFAAIALMLGGVGVFGVIAGEVGRRRKEIGIRLALGAEHSSVAMMMLRHTLVRTLAGVVAGTAVAVMLAKSMASLLFGVQPTDPVSYGVVIACVVGLAALGTLIPVAIAMRRSPLVALREG